MVSILEATGPRGECLSSLPAHDQRIRMKTVSLAAVLAAVSITSASAADLIVKVKDVRAFLDDRRPVGQR
jgi:hypothetical protein